MTMDETVIKDAKSALAMLKDIQPLLEKWADVPPPEARTAAAPAAQTGEVGDAYERIVELRGSLVKQSDRTLGQMISRQLHKGAKEGIGIPFSQWMGGNRSIYAAMSANPDVSKALDTMVGGALIRQDLEPLLYAAFVRRFPLWDRINKVPSNGLVHAYNRQDAAPDATFISELGTVSSGTGTYTRATTNIAIAAIRVGVGLKTQYSVAAGGMGWNPESIEIEGGLTGLRRRLQRTVFSGNDTVPGKVATDPEGLYDANAFTGLRSLVPSGNSQTHDPANYTLAESFNNVDSLLSQYGGMSSILVMDARDRAAWMNELQANARFMLPQLPLIPGLAPIQGIVLGNSGEVPVLAVPGDEIGHYTYSADDVRDAYFIDESVVSVPWLGSEMPTILDIPTGVDGTLSHTFILFQMAGLAVRVPNFIAKLRIPTP